MIARFNQYLALMLFFVMVAVFLVIPLLVGVWLPDIIFAPRTTLASTTLTNGYSFRVVQYWNRSDFYTTELQVTAPDGSIKVTMLDHDDSKSWRVPIEVDEPRRIATVTISGGRPRVVSW